MHRSRISCHPMSGITQRRRDAKGRAAFRSPSQRPKCSCIGLRYENASAEDSRRCPSRWRRPLFLSNNLWVAERVGFVPVVPAPINDLGPIRSPQITKSTQSLRIRYKTGTAILRCFPPLALQRLVQILEGGEPLPYPHAAVSSCSSAPPCGAPERRACDRRRMCLLTLGNLAMREPTTWLAT